MFAPGGYAGEGVVLAALRPAVISVYGRTGFRTRARMVGYLERNAAMDDSIGGS